MPKVKVENGKAYVNGAGDVVRAWENVSKWFDGLPFVVSVIQWGTVGGGLGVGGPERYTVDETGAVWPGKTDRYDLKEEAKIC